MVYNDDISDLANKSNIDKLKELRVNNPKNILLAYRNINSIRNKFESLYSLLADKVDILTIAETKLDGSFPTNQFLIKGFHQPFRLNINRNSGGLLVYIKSSLPVKTLSNYTLPSDIQAIHFELSLKERKWLFLSIYKPPSQNSQYLLNSISDMLDYCSNHYEYKVIFGDFNMNLVKPEMNTFLNSENLTNLIRENTCFKGAGSCIDLILTNSKYSCQYSSSIETGLSDHHDLIFSMMKTKFRNSHRWCSVQKVFLKISQNSRENTCARVSFFIQLQASVN